MTIEVDEKLARRLMRVAPEKLTTPRTAVGVIGGLTAINNALEAQIHEQAAPLKAQIKAITEPFKGLMIDISKSITRARQALNDAVDAGVDEAETPDWKLVVVRSKHPVLDKFDDLPDEFLLPPEQWIDWKKIDEAVNAGKPVPGITLVEVKSPRVVQNKAVKV